MITVNYQNVDFRVVQQGNEVHESGTQTMRGALSLNHEDGVATFVEDTKKENVCKNPVFWRGKYLSLRIDKEGHLRGTFRMEIPADEKTYESQSYLLDRDFIKALEKLAELAEARRPKKRKLKIA